MTELIEKSIKLEYLKKYEKELRTQFEFYRSPDPPDKYDFKYQFEDGEQSYNKDYELWLNDNADNKSKEDKIGNILTVLYKKIKQYEDEILDIALKEIGEEKLEL